MRGSPVFAYHDHFSGVVSIPLQGREVMLCRLIPSVERLCKVADAEGGSSPATPRAISPPLNPRTKR